MDLIISIILACLIAWIAIKSLKIVFWVVGILIVANLLSSFIGLVATIIIIGVYLLSDKKISTGLIIFIGIAFLLGLI